MSLSIVAIGASILVNLSQAEQYRAILVDKGPDKFNPAYEIFQKTLDIHTERCIERRLKVLPLGEVVSIEDAPLYEPYLEEIESLGAEIKLELRWRNYAVVECDSATAVSIGILDFVSAVIPISSKMNIAAKAGLEKMYRSGDVPEILLPESNCGGFDYGASFRQNQMIGTNDLHALGFAGKGVYTAFLDNGFQRRGKAAFETTSYLDEYDFVFGDDDTQNDSLDREDQDHHGTMTLGACGGFYPGVLIGTAPGATYLLAKTENMNSETHYEEDAYAAAIEWAEALGADVSNSSLGYRYFDSANQSYSFKELDGSTTIVARAVNGAVRRGMVCVTSAGNNGPAEKSIVSPADADSSVAVGAISPTDTLLAFSSRGPVASGGIKPDLLAQGIEVTTVAPNEDNMYMYGTGTSLAAPLIAGGVSLLIQAFPEKPTWEIRRAIFESCSNFENPNDSLGRGVPNFHEAALNLGILISPPITYAVREFKRIGFYIESKSKIMRVTANVFFERSGEEEIYELIPSAFENFYYADIPAAIFGGEPADYFVTVETIDDDRRAPFDRDSLFALLPDGVEIPCGVDIANLPHGGDFAEGAYVSPSVVTDFRSSVDLFLPPLDGVKADVSCYSALGGLAWKKSFLIPQKSYANFPIPASNLSAGAYFLFVESGGTRIELKFLISR